MIDFEKTKAEAEAFAKRSVEEYYRELLSAELDELKSVYFGQKKPLKDAIPLFAVALIGLINSARDIFKYVEKVSEDEFEACANKAKEIVKEEGTKAAEEASKYVRASLAITAELNKNNSKTLQEMVDQQAEKAPSTAAEPEHHFHGPIPTTPKAAEPEEPKEEETTTKTRVSSKEIVSDETLELHYFKEGLSVPVIASMYKVGASGLYKRIEAMKAQRKQIEKECARQ